MEQSVHNRKNRQAEWDRQKMTGRTGMPEQVCQDKNAETGRQETKLEQDSQGSHDRRERQNRIDKVGHAE